MGQESGDSLNMRDENELEGTKDQRDSEEEKENPLKKAFVKEIQGMLKETLQDEELL